MFVFCVLKPTTNVCVSMRIVPLLYCLLLFCFKKELPLSLSLDSLPCTIYHHRVFTYTLKSRPIGKSLERQSKCMYAGGYYVCCKIVVKNLSKKESSKSNYEDRSLGKQKFYHHHRYQQSIYIAVSVLGMCFFFFFFSYSAL